MKQAKVKDVFDGELFYCNTSARFYRRVVSLDGTVPDPEHTACAEEARTPGKFVYFSPNATVVV